MATPREIVEPPPPTVRVQRVDKRDKVLEVALASLRWSPLDCDALRYSATYPGDKARADYLPYLRPNSASKYCVRVTILRTSVEVPPEDAPSALLLAFRRLMTYRPSGHVVEVG